MNISGDKAREAVSIIREHGALIRTSEALKLGLHPRTLYYLRDEGIIEQVSRGLYRLADLPQMEAADLVVIAIRVPEAVVCLASALSFHDLTTEVPHVVHIALPKGKKSPRIQHPPIDTYHFSEPTFSHGIEIHSMDGVPVRIYSAAKSVADAFKFRRRTGQNLAVESMKRCIEMRKASPAELYENARICRVDRVMQPYLEALS